MVFDDCFGFGWLFARFSVDRGYWLVVWCLLEHCALCGVGIIHVLGGLGCRFGGSGLVCGF